jgi:hypothetical protein
MDIKCSSCNNAEIFQVNGDYCLHCWQEKTHLMSKTTLYTIERKNKILFVTNLTLLNSVL